MFQSKTITKIPADDDVLVVFYWLFGNTFSMELFSPEGDLQFVPLSSRLVELQCHARSARSPKHSAAAEASIAMSKTCQTRLVPRTVPPPLKKKSSESPSRIQLQYMVPKFMMGWEEDVSKFPTGDKLFGLVHVLQKQRLEVSVFSRET